MRSKLFFMVVSCLLGISVHAANATLDDLYGAANQEMGSASFTFINFGGPGYGYRTKSWATLGDVGDSSWAWSTPDHQAITQPLTGLLPSAAYDVYIVAAGKIDSGAKDWGVRAGFSPDVYSLLTIDIGDDAAITKYNLGLYNNGASYPFREVQTSSTSACMWAVLAGTVTTDASGNATVYVNEIEGIDIGGKIGDRTWYDGVLVTPIPEPATLVLLGLGCLLLRKKK